MPWKLKTSLPLAGLLLLVSGCAASLPPQPEVRVVQTCPPPTPKPATLTTPIEPEFLKRLESLLMEFSKSVQTPTRPPATSTP